MENLQERMENLQERRRRNCRRGGGGGSAGEEEEAAREEGEKLRSSLGVGETENGYRSLSLPLVPVGAKTKFPALSFPPSYLFPA